MNLRVLFFGILAILLLVSAAQVAGMGLGWALECLFVGFCR